MTTRLFLLSMNWVIESLQNALNTWNSKYSEIWQMLTESPDTFRNGQIWNIIISINDAMKGIGTALLVIFFMTGVIKTYSSFSEVKRFESAFRLFLRFSIAKVLISYGLDIMISIFKICEGVILKISETYGISNIYFKLPSEITNALNGISLLDSIPIWCVSILGSLVIWVLSIVLILTVYGRFFKMYMYVAISPIPLSSFAGESTSHIGYSFLKSFALVCLEGAIIMLSCVIYSAFATTTPEIIQNQSVVSMIWQYIGECAFNMLILVGTVKLSDRVVREMAGG